MATKLLPSTKFTASKKIISADSIKSVNKDSSTTEKLGSIRKFLLIDYKSKVSSFIMKRRQRQDEKKKLREENIENKGKKISLPSFKAPAPISNIFDSIGNFLLFMAGGVLFNKFFDLQKSFDGIAKTLEVIGKGVEIVANVVGGFTDFIDSAVKGYDDTLQKIEDITGFDKKKIEKFMEDFKYVINGAVIAAIITVRALPLFVSRFLRNRLKKTPPKPPTPSTPRGFRGLDSQRYRSPGQTRAGSTFELEQLRKTRTKFYSATGLKNVSGPSMSRFNASLAKYISGKANTGDMLRLLRRGFFKPFAKFTLNSKALKFLPYGIGSFIDFLIQYFVFKEPAGRAAFKSIGAGLFGFLGTLLGGPFALFTGIGAAYAGDWAGGKLYDVIFGDKNPQEITAIQESADYDQVTEINNIFLQPIET